MKKLFFGALLLALVIVVPIPTMAQFDINVNIALPPIEFAAPPDVIVLPDTDGVYAAPDVDADLYFWDGWWWRQWEGRWYRSNYYDRDWGYYDKVPSFYFDVDPGWRGYYRDHNWYGHRWDYERIPHQQLQQNWRGWQDNRHWERQGTWGVRDYQPRPKQEIQELRQQRQQQYQQRPEVQRQQKQELQDKGQRQQKQPKLEQQKQEPQDKDQRQQKQEPKDKVQQPQRQEQRPEGQQPQQHSHPQGKPEKVEEE